MAEETGILAGKAAFEPTRWSVVLAAQAPSDPRYLQSWNELVTLYWRPVYRAVRYRWSKPVEEAKDLTQAFFAALFDGGLKTYAPERGRFRTFLKAALGNFLKNARRDAMRIKRGGGTAAVPLEIADEESVTPTEDLFEKEWRRTLFERALEELQGEKPAAFECFRRYFLDPSKPTYRDIAAAVGIGEYDVTNHLHWARGRMRDIVRRLVRESCENDDEFADELRELFG